MVIPVDDVTYFRLAANSPAASKAKVTVRKPNSPTNAQCFPIATILSWVVISRPSIAERDDRTYRKKKVTMVQATRNIPIALANSSSSLNAATTPLPGIRMVA